LLFKYQGFIVPRMNSLGFNKPESKTRVIVAMSGGVDSSVVASLLHEQGYDVVGITLQLYDHGAAIERKGACCAGQDIYDAKRVAEGRGFPHYVLDYEDNFRESVIERFADSYLRGETPIPCVRCNQTVKFRDLIKMARDLGGDCLATGHYIRREVNANGKAELHRAVDPLKDQSYFLFATTQEQLDYLRFPLGGWTKDQTRAEARRLGLANATKSDSQDICFVPNGDYAAVVAKIRPEAQKPGDIVHLDGRIIGQHEGIINYTIGQRKGLGIGGGVSDNNEPLYVVRLESAENRVIVGTKASLARNRVHITECNWLSGYEGTIKIKLRSVSSLYTAHLRRLDQGRAIITLDDPQYGISPGQAAVCYCPDGDMVLGGGWIASTDLMDASQVA